MCHPTVCVYPLLHLPSTIVIPMFEKIESLSFCGRGLSQSSTILKGAAFALAPEGPGEDIMFYCPHDFFKFF